MRINIVIPPQVEKRFTGGALCLLNYANGLAELGHDVTVVASHASAEPLWFAKPWRFRFLAPSARSQMNDLAQATGRAGFEIGKCLLTGRPLLGAVSRKHIRDALDAANGLLGQRGGIGAYTGAAIDNLRRTLPDADVTFATSYETAYAVAVAGTGRLFYFAQHYEPFFWRESLWGDAARRQAELSYGLGLSQIVNSPWLAETLRERHGIRDAPVCSAAIDHRVFAMEPKPRRETNVLNVISYGGRDAAWKGFREMCEGVRLARQRNPTIRLNWSVYGTALIPPDNEVASYDFLGFLDQANLARAYSRHDVLLSASWYESFPLFPLEAMACGLATICTQPGAEVYARHGQTAHIVQPQSPEDIAAALERLALDEPYRLALAGGGRITAAQFTWERAVSRMDSILKASA